MSLSVERVRHMLEVAKKERAESWDGPIEGGNNRTPLIRKPE